MVFDLLLNLHNALIVVVISKVVGIDCALESMISPHDLILEFQKVADRRNQVSSSLFATIFFNLTSIRDVISGEKLFEAIFHRSQLFVKFVKI